MIYAPITPVNVQPGDTCKLHLELDVLGADDLTSTRTIVGIEYRPVFAAGDPPTGFTRTPRWLLRLVNR